MLELSGLSKRFGGTEALRGLDLHAHAGEIVGIAGPNGAGKSTLIHVLGGEIVEDSGTVALDGRLIPFVDRPRFVSVVHQELQLFPTLTVLENLLIGSDGSRFLRPKASPEIRAVAEEFGLLDAADRPLDSCSIVIRQLTEIARAIVHRKQVVLLDEPNSALTVRESERLFTEVLRLREQGRTIVLLVSHRLADLERYCDRVLVVREGTVAAEFSGPQLTTANIAQAIVESFDRPRPSPHDARPPCLQAVGSTEAAVGPHSAASVDAETGLTGATSGAPPARQSRKSVVEVRGWTDSRGGAFSGVDLTVREGEALFITGQEDGGGREILRSIAGFRSATGTAVALPGRAAGQMCYLPGSRASSLFFNLSVRANLCVRLDPRIMGRRGGLLRSDVMTATASEYVDRLEIRAESLASPIGSLSGGTQQKVAIGSAFAGRPRLLIIEDPTRGVDVRTREQIVRSLRAFAAEGNAILAFSPELDEVFELADSVRVAVQGRLSSALDRRSGQSLEELAQWVDRMNQEGSGRAGDSGDEASGPSEEQGFMIRNRWRAARAETNDSIGARP